MSQVKSSAPRDINSAESRFPVALPTKTRDSRAEVRTVYHVSSTELTLPKLPRPSTFRTLKSARQYFLKRILLRTFGSSDLRSVV